MKYQKKKCQQFRAFGAGPGAFSGNYAVKYCMEIKYLALIYELVINYNLFNFFKSFLGFEVLHNLHKICNFAFV